MCIRDRSYTTYALNDLDAALVGEGAVCAAISVSNTGNMDGHQVVQLYGTRLEGDRAGERELLGFTVVFVEAGKTQKAEIEASLQPLNRWDEKARTFVQPAGAVRLEAAFCWGDPETLSTTINVKGA